MIRYSFLFQSLSIESLSLFPDVMSSIAYHINDVAFCKMVMQNYVLVLFQLLV